MKSERISPFWVNGYQPFSATIEELVNESIRLYPNAGEMFTTPQAQKIYTYIKNLDEIEKLKIL